MSDSKKSPKSSHVFPAPEWTSMSASLAASLAHEIRNPLLSIKGAAQLLEHVAHDDDKSLAQLIISEARRIEQLVATMDPLTPNPAQVKEALNIHEITEYVRLAASTNAREVKFVTQYDPSLPDVRGHREALIQALLNVVKNAAEAVADIENPTITITTRYLIGERMQRIGGRKLPIQVKVADNGAGVAVSMLPRLFTPFTTDKPAGKGLGLAIVAKIIEEHEGLVAYEAEPGQPAVFCLYLPQA
jgi:two-component system nitrogen regulation sensor histidine kinase GlnL